MILIDTIRCKSMLRNRRLCNLRIDRKNINRTGASSRCVDHLRVRIRTAFSTRLNNHMVAKKKLGTNPNSNSWPFRTIEKLLIMILVTIRLRQRWPFQIITMTMLVICQLTRGAISWPRLPKRTKLKACTSSNQRLSFSNNTKLPLRINLQGKIETGITPISSNKGSEIIVLIVSTSNSKLKQLQSLRSPSNNVVHSKVADHSSRSNNIGRSSSMSITSTRCKINKSSVSVFKTYSKELTRINAVN